MCQAAALPTSPSHASGVGPSLSPLKGGEGLFDRFLFDNSVPYSSQPSSETGSDARHLR